MILWELCILSTTVFLENVLMGISCLFERRFLWRWLIQIFSIIDYDTVVGTATGNPPLELYYQALQNTGGAIFLQCMFLCTGFLCLVSIHTWQSRMVLPIIPFSFLPLNFRAPFHSCLFYLPCPVHFTPTVAPPPLFHAFRCILHFRSALIVRCGPLRGIEHSRFRLRGLKSILNWESPWMPISHATSSLSSSVRYILLPLQVLLTIFLPPSILWESPFLNPFNPSKIIFVLWYPEFFNSIRCFCHFFMKDTDFSFQFIGYWSYFVSISFLLHSDYFTLDSWTEYPSSRSLLPWKTRSDM